MIIGVQVQRSGYRSKRSNAYGDEQIVRLSVHSNHLMYYSDSGSDGRRHSSCSIGLCRDGSHCSWSTTVRTSTGRISCSRTGRFIDYPNPHFNCRSRDQDIVWRGMHTEMSWSSLLLFSRWYISWCGSPFSFIQTAPVAPVSELAAPVVDQSYVGQVVPARPAISPVWTKELTVIINCICRFTL